MAPQSHIDNNNCGILYHRYTYRCLDFELASEVYERGIRNGNEQVFLQNLQ